MINIKSDSRKIKKGDTFIAVKCEINDGHQYIEKAIENGATQIIAERGNYSVETEIVPNTRIYLNEYLKENYNPILNKMNIIGITGTNGKTTTAKLIHDALNQLGSKTAYIGTIGFYMQDKVCDLPNTSVDICDMYDLLITAYDNGCKNVVLEVSSHALANGRMETLNFDYAIYTNLTQDHLDFHKTMENYALAKQKLFKKLKPTGKAIINVDDSYKDYFLLDENQNITYGKNGSDYQLIDCKLSSENTKFTYKHNGEKIEIQSKLLGDYNVYNMLGCICLLSCLNYKSEDIIRVTSLLEAPVGRSEIIKYNKNNIVIDYAHTPDAISKIIKTMQQFTKGNTYVVFGCTGDRDRSKRKIMSKLVSELSNYFIFTNDDPHDEDPNQIVSDAFENADFSNYEVCLDRKEAIIKGIKLLKEDDLLLILGKGHEEKMIVKNKKAIPFNDKKVVLEYLREI